MSKPGQQKMGMILGRHEGGGGALAAAHTAALDLNDPHQAQLAVFKQQKDQR